MVSFGSRPPSEFTCGGRLPRMLTASHLECWVAALLPTSAPARPGVSPVGTSSSGAEQLRSAGSDAGSELSQGQPSTLVKDWSQKTHVQCPLLSVGQCCDVLFTSPQDAPGGRNPSSGCSVPLPLLALLSPHPCFPSSLTCAPWDRLPNKLSQVTHTNPGSCLRVFFGGTQAKMAILVD